MVLAVNGEPIDSSRGLIRAVAAMPPGSSVSLTVRRQGHDIDVAGHGRPPAAPTGVAG